MMVVVIKDEKLYASVFKRIDEYDQKQKYVLAKGNIKYAKAYERLSDKLYEKYYYKIFEVKK